MFALQHSKLYDAFRRKVSIKINVTLKAANSHQGTPKFFCCLFFPRKDRSQKTKPQKKPVQKPSPDLSLRKAQDWPNKLSTQQSQTKTQSQPWIATFVSQ